MSPALDHPDRAHAGMLAQELVVDQDHARPAVGHLAAVVAADPALDGRVGLVVAAVRGEVGHLPVAGLGVGVAAGVGEVQRGDRVQVRLVDAVPAVVLVGDVGEHRRPHELRVGALVTRPRRRAQMLGGGVAGHGLLQFQSDHQCGAVVARPQVGHRRENRHTARCARGLVPGGRCVPESVVDGGRHGAEVTLAGEHLAERIGDVHHVDVGRVDHRLGQREIDDLAGQLGEVAALPGQVAREVALVPTENPDIACHKAEATTAKRVGGPDWQVGHRGGPAGSWSEPTGPRGRSCRRLRPLAASIAPPLRPQT